MGRYLGVAILPVADLVAAILAPLPDSKGTANNAVDVSFIAIRLWYSYSAIDLQVEFDSGK